MMRLGPTALLLISAGCGSLPTPPQEGDRISAIVGDVTSTTARIWVRGQPDDTQLDVKIAQSGEVLRRESVALDLEIASAGVLDLEGLIPDTDYSVSFHTGGEHEQATFRTWGGASERFKFLVLSCNKNYNGEDNFEAIEQICSENDVRLVLHCGDQIYYGHEKDKCPPSAELYRQRYDQTWGADEYARKLLGRLPNYMVLDDHDIADDFNKAALLSERVDAHSAAEHLEFGLPAYETFQRSHGPRPVREGKHYYSFSVPGAEFFVMDVRLDRRPYRSFALDSEMVSEEQMQDLQCWLSTHRDRLKFVVSSLPFVGEVSFVSKRLSSDKKWDQGGFNDQRKRLVRFIAESDHGRLVFLAGDMHASYVASLTKKGNEELPLAYELMASPVSHALRAFRDVGLRDRPKIVVKLRDGDIISDIGEIHAKKAVVLVEVAPGSSVVKYEIVGLKGRKTLERGELSWSPTEETK